MCYHQWLSRRPPPRPAAPASCSEACQTRPARRARSPGCRRVLGLGLAVHRVTVLALRGQKGQWELGPGPCRTRACRAAAETDGRPVGPSCSVPASRLLGEEWSPPTPPSDAGFLGLRPPLTASGSFHSGRARLWPCPRSGGAPHAPGQVGRRDRGGCAPGHSAVILPDPCPSAKSPSPPLP